MPKKQFSHVRFFPSTKDLIKAVLDTVRFGDYVYASRKGSPLWTSVQEGLVTRTKIKECKPVGVSLLECEDLTIPSHERFGTTVQVSRWAPREKPLNLQDYRGFRIDHSMIFTTIPGTVERYNLTVGAQTKLEPFEHPSGSSLTRFLREVEAGDYLTVWSEEDEHSVRPFLHYPVQGWVTDKNLKKKEVSYIHPPRMDVQTFKFREHPNCQQVMGFYRKLVLQLDHDEAPVQLAKRVR